ncbi:HIT family protein [Ideonella sp.]|uniref:HIT family protein n=1 Tax=Ideonella sp. TaxID=1929293 RepID=UPI002B487C14|nr:HIT family protein [Ideonella sp.]HJV68115.1 HIT family protein [Ideonella sp.]
MAAAAVQPGCELCAAAPSAAWAEVAADDRLRVVRVLDAPDFPAFYRVIWREHVAELSDLSSADRAHCLEVVVAVERVLREALAPTKINLASLGNMVPHLHWHVIARFDWDSHFPQPIWGARQREVMLPAAERLARPMTMLDESIRHSLAGGAAALVSIAGLRSPRP